MEAVLRVMKIRAVMSVAILVAVVSAAALVPPTAQAAPPVQISWSGPTAANIGPLTAVACAPGTSTCTAASATGEVVTISAGATPSAPTNVTTPTSLTSISCPTTATCFTGDATGTVTEITGSAQHTTALATDGAITGISCPNTSFCAATDADGLAFTFNGSTWSPGVALASPADDLDAVSCADAGFCQASDRTGSAFMYMGPFTSTNGTNWSPADPAASDGNLSAVSCPTSQFCDAVSQTSGGSAGASYFFDPRRDQSSGLGLPVWETNGNSFPSGTSFDAVACPSANFCDLGGATGVESTDLPESPDLTQTTQWVPTSSDPNVTGVACATSVYCVAVDTAGNVLTSTGPPQNTVLPTIPTSLAADSTVTVDPGTWLGASGGYSYQWLGCAASNGPCGYLSGATNQSISTSVGSYLEVEVTAANPQGTSEVFSHITGPIGPAPVAPANTTLPSISGTPAVGQTLTGTVGTFSGTTPITYAEQWYACAARCTAILGATGSALKLSTAEVGQEITLVVTASNAGGTAAPVASGLTAVVTAPATPSTVTTPTGAIVKAWLAPLVRLSGVPGRLTSVKKAKGYTVAFKAAIPGTVKVTWTVSEKIAHSKRTKTVTLASVNAKTKVPSTQLKIRLNATGVKLLKKLKSQKVRATATFTYTLGTVTHSFQATRILTLTH